MIICGNPSVPWTGIFLVEQTCMMTKRLGPVATWEESLHKRCCGTGRGQFRSLSGAGAGEAGRGVVNRSRPFRWVPLYLLWTGTGVWQNHSLPKGAPPTANERNCLGLCPTTSLVKRFFHVAKTGEPFPSSSKLLNREFCPSLELA